MLRSSDQARTFKRIYIPFGPKVSLFFEQISFSYELLWTFFATVAGKAKEKPAAKPASAAAAASQQESQPEHDAGEGNQGNQEEGEEEATKEDDPALEDDGDGSDAKNVDWGSLVQTSCH